MAASTLPASADFFKKLSLDYHQLKLTIRLIETFAFRASGRGIELGDHQLLVILDQLQGFVFKANYLLDNIEKRLYKHED